MVFTARQNFFEHFLCQSGSNQAASQFDLWLMVIETLHSFDEILNFFPLTTLCVNDGQPR